MKNKKTVYIWVLIILEILSIPFSLMALFDDSYTGSVTLGYVGMFFNIVAVVIALIWLHRAFLLKSDLVKWTNINYGFGIFVLLFSSIGIYINTGDIIAASVGNLFMLIVLIVIWITFVKRIKKSISNNKIQLS